MVSRWQLPVGSFCNTGSITTTRTSKYGLVPDYFCKWSSFLSHRFFHPHWPIKTDSHHVGLPSLRAHTRWCFFTLPGPSTRWRPSELRSFGSLSLGYFGLSALELLMMLRRHSWYTGQHVVLMAWYIAAKYELFSVRYNVFIIFRISTVLRNLFFLWSGVAVVERCISIYFFHVSRNASELTLACPLSASCWQGGYWRYCGWPGSQRVIFLNQHRFRCSEVRPKK